MKKEITYEETIDLENKIRPILKQDGLDLIWRDHKMLSDKADKYSVTITKQYDGERRRLDLDEISTIGELYATFSSIAGTVSLLHPAMDLPKITGKTSDGYHTFDELYEHRTENYIALCRTLQRHSHYSGAARVWKSKLHSDGSSYPDWFILGINTEPGTQITYHLPMYKWDACVFAAELNKAPEFDGHTSADVLKRISEL